MTSLEQLNPISNGELEQLLGKQALQFLGAVYDMPDSAHIGESRMATWDYLTPLAIQSPEPTSDNEAPEHSVSMATLNRFTVPQAKTLGRLVRKELIQGVEDAEEEPQDDVLTKTYKELGHIGVGQAVELGSILKSIAEQNLLKLSKLDEKEREVLLLAAHDTPPKKIQEIMNIGESIFYKCWSSIKAKLDVTDRVEAISVLPLKLNSLSDNDFYGLSLRERDLLAGLARGLSLDDISRELELKSAGGLSMTRARLKRRLGIKTASIFKLTIDANRDVIQAAEDSIYHQARVTFLEIQAIQLMLQGSTKKDIAAAMNLSLSGAYNHMKSGQKKLKVTNVEELQKLLESPPELESPEAISLPVAGEDVARESEDTHVLQDESHRVISLEELREHIEETLKPVITMLAKALARGKRISNIELEGAPLRMPLSIMPLLERNGVGTNPALVERGRARSEGVIAALLLENGLDPRALSDPTLQETILLIIEREVREAEVKQA